MLILPDYEKGIFCLNKEFYHINDLTKIKKQMFCLQNCYELLLYIQGPVSFKVQVPIMADKPEWRCSGQTINITLLPSDNITTVKAKVHEATGMPPGKQKLQLEVITIS